MLRHFLGILDPELAAASARWIRVQSARRRDLGHLLRRSRRICPPPSRPTWPCVWPANRPSRHPYAAAAAWVRANGGIEPAAGSSPGSGWPSWAGGTGTTCRSCRPRSCSCRPWAPLNIYDFGCWARQTVVALTMVMAHRPARPLPFALDELRAPAASEVPPPPSGRSRWSALRSTSGRFLPSTGSCTATNDCPLVPPPTPAAPVGPAASRAMDRPPPGGRRALGRDPTARRLLDHGPAPAGLSPRPPGDAGRPGRPRRFRHPRRPGPAHGGVPVAGVGHRPGHGGPGRCRRRCRRPRPGGRGRLAPRRGDHRARRLGHPSTRGWRPAAGPSSSPTTTIPTSTTPPRWCWPCAGPTAAADPASDDACARAVAWTVGHAMRRRRLGRLRRRQRQSSGRGPALLRLRQG